MVTMKGLAIKLRKIEMEGKKKTSPILPSSPKKDRKDKAKSVKQDKVSNSQSKTLSPNVSISDASCSEDEGLNDNMSCSTNETNVSVASKRLSKVQKAISRPFRHSKARGKLTRTMKEHLLRCYRIAKQKAKDESKPKTWRYREARKLWLQMYPSSSLSLTSVKGICKSPKLALTDSDNETLADYLSRFGNVPDCTTRLKSMRQASLELASQPI